MDAIKNILKKILSTNVHQMRFDISMLGLRLVAGIFMAAGHGWGKLSSYSEMSSTFADPFGLGSPISLALAIMAEFFAAIAVALGLFTRLAAFPVIFTMGVAAFWAHGGDPFFGIPGKEFALLYLTPFLFILVMGPGRYSLDALINKSLLS